MAKSVQFYNKIHYWSSLHGKHIIIKDMCVLMGSAHIHINLQDYESNKKQDCFNVTNKLPLSANMRMLASIAVNTIIQGA